MTPRKLNKIVIVVRALILTLGLSFTLCAQGKNPIILIPGMTGSELRHKDTKDKVWFKTLKSKSEDLRLPILADPTKMHDDLVATGALRTVKIAFFPVYDVYGDFISGMEKRGGYREEDWNAPSEDGYKDALYVFAYDWRLDAVGNARLLIRQIDELRAKLRRPTLKFDVVAHSMGGLLSRYAAMYGDADLPSGRARPRPTWAGADYFNKIVLLGTPNEGSALSLNALVNGYSIGNVRIDVPFVQDSSKFLVFTIPAAYELLPAPGTLRAFDDKLEPIELDIYDPKTWTKYGWNPIDDKEFASQFSLAERKVAPAYFAAALDRARRWHEALAAPTVAASGISFYLIGSDCKTALDAIVVYHNGDSPTWKTAFRPNGFKRTDGVKITDEELRKIMLAPGDGIVTRRSLDGFSTSGNKFFCEGHNRLAENDQIQDYIIGLLAGADAESKTETTDKE